MFTKSYGDVHRAGVPLGDLYCNTKKFFRQAIFDV